MVGVRLVASIRFPPDAPAPSPRRGRCASCEQTALDRCDHRQRWGGGATQRRLQKRAGRRASRQARAATVHALRQGWRPFLTSIGWFALGIVLLYAITWTLPNILRGFQLGATAASCVWVIATLLRLGDGGQNLRIGAAAERFTAEELRKLGPGWQVVDAVEFDGFDVDHVAIGPGGVLAVESKWTASPWDVDGDRLVGRRYVLEHRPRRRSVSRRGLSGTVRMTDASGGSGDERKR